MHVKIAYRITSHLLISFTCQSQFTYICTWQVFIYDPANNHKRCSIQYSSLTSHVLLPKLLLSPLKMYKNKNHNRHTKDNHRNTTNRSNKWNCIIVTCETVSIFCCQTKTGQLPYAGQPMQGPESLAWHLMNWNKPIHTALAILPACLLINYI